MKIDFNEYVKAQAKERADYIPDGGINEAIANWHSKQERRPFTCATPSTLTTCPRVVWRKWKENIPPTNEMGWGKKQRLLLGFITENKIAEQLGDKLLHHWKDADETTEPFVVGEGDTKIAGTPDLLIKLDDEVLISDSKTSRGDSFKYVGITPEEIFRDELWYKYKVQVEMYYHLCHANKEWFDERQLPLPEKCHLFSYALDDGVVRREITWTPSIPKLELANFAKRFNQALKSDIEPECTCTTTTTKFCDYASEFEYTRSGYKLGVKCCD